MIDIIKRCSLFIGIAEKELEALLGCLSARKIKTQKGELVFRAGDRPDYIGIVIKGKVHVLQEDYWGNRTILTDVVEGGLFGEAFSCAQVPSLPVSVIVKEAGEVLLIDCKKILTTCSSACVFHAHLIQNLIKILANKNIMMTQKMEHITKKTTREKVLSYLSKCAVQNEANHFTIPFNRQELADYLSVERSALSNILSKMQDEGEIKFEKNHFTLLS